jgi:hypothetical protein
MNFLRDIMKISDYPAHNFNIGRAASAVKQSQISMCVLRVTEVVQLCWRTFGGQWSLDPDTAPVAVQVTDFLRTYSTTMMDYRRLTASTMWDRRGSRERGVQVLMYAQYLLKNKVSVASVCLCVCVVELVLHCHHCTAGGTVR